MSDQHKQNQGTQQDDWKKKQDQQGGQHSGQQQSGQQGGQKYPQSDRDRMDKDEQRKPA